MHILDRRHFLRSAGLGYISLRFAPLMLAQTVRAAVSANASNKALVVIFQRGACDGLSMLPPIAEPEYFGYRPHIAIGSKTEKAAILLDDHFGMHPSLAALKPYWDNGTLAFVHQCGSPDSTRSHFDAQDYMESGTPGLKSTDDGYLNRAMNLMPYTGNSKLRAVALQANMPRSLQGHFPALSMNSLHEFGIRGEFAGSQVVNGFENMYQQATDQALRGVGNEVFDSLKVVQDTDANRGKNDIYPKNPVANRLKEIASLIKAKVGLQVAATDCGGWDTHVNQGDAKGQLSDRLKELSEAMAAFAKDLGPQFNDVVVVTMTEFGRTVRENGNRGTDHGHGSVMSLLGGRVRGKNIFTRWKSLTPANLNENRDLPVTTDYREIMSELLGHHMGITSQESIFPKFQSPVFYHRVLNT